MEAIILAAGVGSRLAPYTDNSPKSLVPVINKPILQYQIDSYINAGVQTIHIVTGYLGDKIKNFIYNVYNGNNISINIIENADYASTNNMYSLYLALKKVNSDSFFLSNADVVIDKDVISHIIKHPCENGIAYEHGNFNDESMKIIVKDERISHISKKIIEKDSAGTSIDIYKIGLSGKTALTNEIKRIIEIEKDLNSWTEVALDNILDKAIFKPVNIESLFWYEIDTIEDLHIAEGKINEK